MKRRREGIGFGSNQHGRRCRALKNRVPAQKEEMDANDFR